MHKKSHVPKNNQKYNEAIQQAVRLFANNIWCDDDDSFTTDFFCKTAKESNG